MNLYCPLLYLLLSIYTQYHSPSSYSYASDRVFWTQVEGHPVVRSSSRYSPVCVRVICEEVWRFVCDNFVSPNPCNRVYRKEHCVHWDTGCLRFLVWNSKRILFMRCSSVFLTFFFSHECYKCYMDGGTCKQSLKREIPYTYNQDSVYCPMDIHNRGIPPWMTMISLSALPGLYEFFFLCSFFIKAGWHSQLLHIANFFFARIPARVWDHYLTVTHLTINLMLMCVKTINITRWHD